MEVTSDIEVSHANEQKEFKISKPRILIENARSGLEIASSHWDATMVMYQAVTSFAAFGLLGSGDINSKIGGMVAFGFAVGSPIATAQVIYENMRIPRIEKVYPEIENFSIGDATKILSDGARAVSSRNSSSADFLFSTLGYKTALIDAISTKLKTPDDQSLLLGIMAEISDPELKLHLIKSIGKNTKSELRNLVIFQLSDQKTPLADAATSYLKLAWGLADRKDIDIKTNADMLVNLRQKNILKNAQHISETVINGLDKDFPATMLPFVKLFAYRRLKEELGKGNIPDPNGEVFAGVIRTEIISRLNKFNILLDEKSYNPNNITIGLEVQPTRLGDGTPLRMDVKEINRLTEYAGFKHSPDKPFEVVISPTKSVISQALILEEILVLTGIPVDRLGVQLNFGGITEIPTAISLQRMILSAGRLNTLLASKSEVSMWKIGPTSLEKGEINVKNTKSSNGDDVISINPSDEKHPEFKSVAEMRAPTGAQSFFVFVRGLVEASRLANYAKSYDRSRSGVDLLGVENKMAEMYGKAISSYNDILSEMGLPAVDKEWSKDNWTTFFELIQKEGTSDRFKKVLSNTLI